MPRALPYLLATHVSFVTTSSFGTTYSFGIFGDLAMAGKDDEKRKEKEDELKEEQRVQREIEGSVFTSRSLSISIFCSLSLHTTYKYLLHHLVSSLSPLFALS